MWRKKPDWGTLEGVLKGSWEMLEKGARRFDDPFHWPVLGTLRNGSSSVRTVILRDFILPERALVCYTDARAPKADDICQESRVSWLFYHPKRKVQLRIGADAVLHSDDEVAERYWAKTRGPNRLNYLTTDRPGARVDKPVAGLPNLLKEKAPALAESGKGRENFMAIVAGITDMDWLLLNPLGNRRAQFSWDGDRMSASWVVP